MFCYSVIKVSLSCESFYILSHRLLFVKNFFQLLFWSCLVFLFRLFQKKLFFYVVQLLYLITHVLSCQELFHLSEDFLSDFFQINVLSCATYVIISQQYNYVKLFLIFFLFWKKRWILYLFYNGTRITPSLTLLS